MFVKRMILKQEYVELNKEFDEIFLFSDLHGNLFIDHKFSVECLHLNFLDRQTNINSHY